METQVRSLFAHVKINTARFEKALAEELGLPLVEVQRGSFLIEHQGEEENVKITWTGIKTMSVDDVGEILDRVHKEL